MEAGEGQLYHTQARGQPPHCRNHRQYDTGLTQSFSRKTELSTQVITVLKSSVSAQGEAPSLPAEHPHGLVVPSLYILQNCIPTANLGTAIVIPILPMGKLRLGEVKQLESGRGWPA